jgi:hypothetical protein
MKLTMRERKRDKERERESDREKERKREREIHLEEGGGERLYNRESEGQKRVQERA